MDFMICKYGYRKEKDKRVWCKKDNNLCAHVYMCQLNCRWQQTNQAADCTKCAEPQPAAEPEAKAAKAPKGRKGKK